ncbi:cell division and transport-associated protein TolA [Hoeflea marina]|uniref:Cell division and transport-associated protein TolA n=1 Tax=Hoeflea marina TaxID=274592 RepID=A0A317PCE2_9HYPH|nr:hypothetical protein [Hoeflea marina]PWV95502.1 cell division and transport-associated protein TolA [Hoeflea marina]
MKGSLVASTVFHALIIGFAVSSFTAPRTLEVTDMEALPVDIVPVESITQIQRGDKKAPMAEKSAPTPTKRPDPVADAENVGENDADLKPVEAAKASPREVTSQAPPKAVETPVPAPEPEPKPAQEVAKAEPAPEPDPVTPPKPAEKPAAEVEPAPEAKPEPAKPTETASPPAETTPDPVAEAIEQAAPAEPDFTALPTAGPVPAARPKPEKPVETASAEPARETPKPAKPAKPAQAAGGSSKKSDFNADEVAALLNKQDSSGGGAKRSTETASLGGSKTTSGETLSQSEMDALRGQIQKFWNIIPGMADGGDVRVIVKMRLDPSGNIIGDPEVSATGGAAGTRGTLAGSAKRAVLRAQPYQLPAEKYDTWSEVVVNFDPSQMF